MMTATFSTAAQQKPDTFRSISLTALLTGILDICAAIVKFYIDTGQGAQLKLPPGETTEPVSFFTFLTHGGPGRIFKFIASGVFGKDAAISEALLVTWGVVFHFMIAFLFTAFLFVIYPRVVSRLRNKYIVGLIYGVFIWAVMHLLVVPFSNTPAISFDPGQAIIAALIHICMIGIPAALIADKHYTIKAISR